MPQYFSFNPNQPISCAGKCDPTQPNPWMDPTHVHLCAVLLECQGKRDVWINQHVTAVFLSARCFHSLHLRKLAHTRLPSVGSRSWSRFLAVSLQVTWVINPAVGCRPVWARGCSRISPPRFLAECCKRQLNQGSFVLLYFRLFLSLICIEFVYLYFPYCFVCQYQSSDWL